MTLNFVNLDILASYLESLPDDYMHFDMDEFFGTYERVSPG